MIGKFGIYIYIYDTGYTCLGHCATPALAGFIWSREFLGSTDFCLTILKGNVSHQRFEELFGQTQSNKNAITGRKTKQNKFEE